MFTTQQIINLFHEVVRTQALLMQCVYLGYDPQVIAPALAHVNRRIDNAYSKYPWLRDLYDNFYYEYSF